jgi:hypothetical protein
VVWKRIVTTANEKILIEDLDINESSIGLATVTSFDLIQLFVSLSPATKHVDQIVNHYTSSFESRCLQLRKSLKKLIVGVKFENFFKQGKFGKTL